LILVSGLLLGFLAGIVQARLQRRRWSPPQVSLGWLAILAFLPQFIVFYLPPFRTRIPDLWVAVSLVLSQIVLLVFCWFNRRQPGFWFLTFGLALNLLVIISNGGWMPISPQTASHLVPAERLQSIPLGNRFGFGKDVLLSEEMIHFSFLSDRFLLPDWSPYKVAFSLGDLFIAAGAFLVMVIDTEKGKAEEDPKRI
jgi:hypothetical protein